MSTSPRRSVPIQSRQSLGFLTHHSKPQFNLLISFYFKS
ncbi:unnamed protein product [Rhodiola kirilowii]